MGSTTAHRRAARVLTGSRRAQHTHQQHGDSSNLLTTQETSCSTNHLRLPNSVDNVLWLAVTLGAPAAHSMAHSHLSARTCLRRNHPTRMCAGPVCDLRLLLMALLQIFLLIPLP